MCIVFFLGYLVCYFIRCRKVKYGAELPETINTVKWYGFSKDLFYLYDKNTGFVMKKCDKEEKDYLRLKYSALPKYKLFFWKIPAYLLLITITVMTIFGVIKSGTNFNGKLAWYLYRWNHKPVVVEQQKEDTTKQEDNTIVVVEIVEESTEKTDTDQKENVNDNKELIEETVPVENPDDEVYGTTQLVERCYKDENDEIVFGYEIYEYFFSDSKYQKVNETLQSIYDKKELEYQEVAKLQEGISYSENIPEGQADYKETVWSLADLTYVEEDYISLIFKEITYGLEVVNYLPFFSAVTIDIQTGIIADVEEVTGYTWEQLGMSSISYVFCLYGDDVYFIESPRQYEKPIIVPRADVKNGYLEIQDEVFRNIILELMRTNTFPATDGITCSGMPYNNSYSIMDIDDDGKEELLINYANAESLNGMVIYIYDYNRETKEIYIEYKGWPVMSVFDNGYIKEEASHNHGKSNLSDFWPYTLLKYDEKKDRYEYVAYIDAWQYQIHKDLPPDPEFPIAEDLDWDGIVYYQASTDDYEPTEIMDKTEYDVWCTQYNGGNIKEIIWISIISERKYNAMFPR